MKKLANFRKSSLLTLLVCMATAGSFCAAASAAPGHGASTASADGKAHKPAAKPMQVLANPNPLELPYHYAPDNDLAGNYAQYKNSLHQHSRNMHNGINKSLPVAGNQQAKNQAINKDTQRHKLRIGLGTGSLGSVKDDLAANSVTYENFGDGDSSALGVRGNFSWSEKQQMGDSQGKDVNRYVVEVGPALRLNDNFTVYGAAGVANSGFDESDARAKREGTQPNLSTGIEFHW